MSVRRPTTGEAFALGWAAGAVLIIAGSAALFEWNPFVTPVVYGLWLLVWVCVLGWLLLGRQWRAAGLHAILTGLVLFLWPLIDGAGARVWFWTRFQASEATYADIVARAADLPDEGKVGTVAYRIARGAVTRIAFPQPVGVADNWGAVVHDPSDAVASARGWDGEPGVFTARPDLKKLWGGDLLSCQRITGHYYRCDFT